MEKDIVITRVFNAPVHLVWQAWTKEEYITQWWGPKGLHTEVKEMDFRQGGRWEYVMIDGNGNKYPAIGIFKEIVINKKISSTGDFDDDFKAGTTIDLPKVLLFTTLFEEMGSKTKLTLVYEHPTVEDVEKHVKMGVVGGWNTSLDKLADLFENQLKTN